MIRHRPLGRGHPYRIDPEQRYPVWPAIEEPFTLNATTDADTVQVVVECDVRGQRQFINAEQIDMPVAKDSSGTHLAAAALTSGLSKGRRRWEAKLPGLPADAGLRYRFIAGRRRTPWYGVQPFEWRRDGGRLEVESAAGVGARLIPESTEWLMGGRGAARLRFALRLEPKEHVVGFGERFDALDQRGRRLDAQVFEQYKRQGNRTYLPMPFAIVTGANGWGFHVATSRRTWFDVGATNEDRLLVEVELDPQETGPEARPSVLLRLFAGEPAEVLGQFLNVIGPPKEPPEWVFGLWMSANEWNTQARVMEVVRRSIEEQIPAGVVVIEAWSDEATFTVFRDAEYAPQKDRPHRLSDFRFPKEGAWPDPKRMVDDLHDMGLKVLLWQIPLLKQMRPGPPQLVADRKVMLQQGYAVKTADGRPYRNRGWWFPGALMPDFTSEEARSWWLSKRRYLVEDVGIDGFKTDGGEHAWGEDLRYADGSRGSAGNNAFPVAYSAAYHQLFNELGLNGITFSRAGFTGSQAYPAHWAGDEASTWDAFRASIVAGLTAGACGIFYWGWDMAGFSGEIPTAELYLRAAAMACFCPIMQYHSEFNHHRRPSGDRTPWNIAERTGDERVLPVFRRFAQLRQRLMPYLTAQSRRSLERSRPLMRSLFFEFPDDSSIWEWPSQYMLGDDLLVAPVVQPGVESWPIYLPAGEWVHLWSGDVVRGGHIIESRAPIDEIPVYVRSGAGTRLRSDLLGPD
jgi:alpha-glucosidase (family GH31 glycosyl hydrolase)